MSFNDTELHTNSAPHIGSLTLSPLTLSVLGVLVLGASSWMMRKQLASASVPAVKQLSSLFHRPWVTPLTSWLKECPYQVSISNRLSPH